MVARADMPGDAPRRTGARPLAAPLFRSWRHLLTVAVARRAPLDAAVSAAWMPLLAALRLVVMRLVAPRRPSAEVRDAQATGLIAQVIGVTDPLRVIALGLWTWAAGVEAAF